MASLYERRDSVRILPVHVHCPNAASQLPVSLEPQRLGRVLQPVVLVGYCFFRYGCIWEVDICVFGRVFVD